MYEISEELNRSSVIQGILESMTEKDEFLELIVKNELRPELFIEVGLPFEIFGQNPIPKDSIGKRIRIMGLLKSFKYGLLIGKHIKIEKEENWWVPVNYLEGVLEKGWFE